MYSLKPLKRINTDARLSIKIEVKKVGLEMMLEFITQFRGDPYLYPLHFDRKKSANFAPFFADFGIFAICSPALTRRQHLFSAG